MKDRQFFFDHLVCSFTRFLDPWGFQLFWKIIILFAENLANPRSWETFLIIFTIGFSCPSTGKVALEPEEEDERNMETHFYKHFPVCVSNFFILFSTPFLGNIFPDHQETVTRICPGFHFLDFWCLTLEPWLVITVLSPLGALLLDITAEWQ